MRALAIVHARALRVAAALTFAVVATASAQPASPPPAGDLAAMMRVYASGMARQRRLVEACAMDRLTGWIEGEALLIASLRPAGITEADADDLRARLNEAGEKPDCASDRSKALLELVTKDSWSGIHSAMLRSIGVAVVEPEAISAAERRLANVRAVFAEHIAAQRRMMVCLSVIDPRWLPTAWADWDRMLGEVRADMLGAGVGQLDMTAIVLPAGSRELMAGLNGDAAALIDGCIADRTWSDRMYLLTWYTVRKQVQEALAPAQP
jgi:hypothetical protein